MLVNALGFDIILAAKLLRYARFDEGFDWICTVHIVCFLSWFDLRIAFYVYILPFPDLVL
jgi:hypothetical protein